MRTLAVFCAAVTAVLAMTASSSAKVPGACAATVANGYVPPGAPSTFYGNGLLATAAYASIVRSPDADGSFSEKYPWWGAGVPAKPLRIVGQRLGLLTPLMVLRVNEGFSARANEGYVEGSPRGTRFWSSSVTFPTEGCWRIMGAVGPVRLSVVVLVRAAP